MQSYKTKSQDERVQKRTARAVCVTSANDQAELMNQSHNTMGMWLRRDALRAIDLSRKPMQPRGRCLVELSIAGLLRQVIGEQLKE